MISASSVALAQQPAHPGILLGGATTVEIDSIDPANEDFGDLEPLKALIGDARVVVLGEQSHGDGPVFLCKARLVKFLHQEMGFDVLCWESGLLGCELMNEQIADASVPIGEAFDGVFGIWTLSSQVHPTMEYARLSHQTDRPLIQAGFDAQLTSPRLGEALAERIEALGAPDDEASALVRQAFGPTRDLSVETLTSLAEALDALDAWLETQTLDEEAAFTRRVCGDAAWFARMMIARLEGKTMQDDPDMFNERDRRMGDNLVYLANERYEGRKIIVWAATRHMVHRQKEIIYPDGPGLYDIMDSAGETAFDRLGDDLYTIGFTALRGRVGNCFRDESRAIDEPREGSIEWALDAVAHPFVFVDFRTLDDDHPLRDPQVMRPLGYGWMEARWPEQMDAVICIDRMFKSDQRVIVPVGYELTVGR